MLKMYSFQKGSVSEGSAKDLAAASVCWANCIAPSEEELKEISENTRIPLEELRDALDPEQRPKVSDLEEHSLIIVRTPWEEEDGTIATIPVSIFVSKTKNNAITLCPQQTKALKKMEEDRKSTRLNS